jgi:hypothetical protein
MGLDDVYNAIMGLSNLVASVIVFIGWFFYLLGYIIFQLLSFVNYIFGFLKSFFVHIFDTPIIPDGFSYFSTSTIGVIKEIPYYNQLALALAIAFLVIGAIAIIKLFTK